MAQQSREDAGITSIYIQTMLQQVHAAPPDGVLWRAEIGQGLLAVPVQHVKMARCGLEAALVVSQPCSSLNSRHSIVVYLAIKI